MSIIKVDYSEVGGGEIKSGYLATADSTGKITCGFKPRLIEYMVLMTNVANNYEVVQYDVTVDTDKYTRHLMTNNTVTTPSVGDTSQTGGLMSVDNDGFTIAFGSLAYTQFQRIRWVAAE